MTTTPPNSTPNVVQSTPLAAGTASNTCHESHTTQDAYESFLAVDIANTVPIPFEAFLSSVFGLPAAETELYPIFEAITSDPKVKSNLDAYMNYAEKETDRYHPFNNLVEVITKGLGSKSEDIAVCRNDPVLVIGSSGDRKPDCVVVYRASLEKIHDRMSVDNLSKKGPDGCAFHWFELLAFVEFKLINRVANAKEAAPRQKAEPKPLPSSKSSSKTKAKSGHVASSGGPSRYGLRSSTGSQAPAASTSGTHSAVATTSLNVAATSRPSSHSSGNTQSSLSQKRTGEALQAPPKKPRTEASDPLKQCASYALEMLSHSGLRTHVLGALVTDAKLELLYYDRSVVVKSDPINFLDNPSSLVAFVHCMRRLTFEQWGYSNKITLAKTPRQGPFTKHFNPLHDATLKLSIGVVLKLGDVIFIQHALVSRGTCVVHAEVLECPPEYMDWKGKRIVVKFTFTPDTRQAEGDILDYITKHATGKDKGTGNDGAQAQDDDHSWVLDHLPDVLHYEAFPPDGADAQSRVSQYLKTHGFEYENRVLQVLVMTELFPITQLTTTETLIPVIRDIFKCYRWLYEEAKVIHRDISLNNLMFRKKPDGSFCGVLSDFDLSLFLARQDRGPSSRQRTGTTPYMAIDLLLPSPMQHLYRHDLESLFYVLIILTTGYHEGWEIANPPLQAWFDPITTVQLLEKKSHFVLLLSVPQPTPHFANTRPLLLKLKELVKQGYSARTSHLTMVELKQETKEFDEYTLGGHIDFRAFANILFHPID